jgi:hypothetical protein
MAFWLTMNYFSIINLKILIPTWTSSACPAFQQRQESLDSRVSVQRRRPGKYCTKAIKNIYFVYKK